MTRLGFLVWNAYIAILSRAAISTSYPAFIKSERTTVCEVGSSEMMRIFSTLRRHSHLSPETQAVAHNRDNIGLKGIA